MTRRPGAAGRTVTGLAAALIATLWALCPPVFSERAGGFMDDYFAAKKLDATLVIRSVKTGREYVHNPKRAGKRFSPASTFKIPNSLIALRAGAVKGVNEVIPWDGTKSTVPECGAGQDMKSAFSRSCVWFYQVLARRVGADNYRKALDEMNYGNRRMGRRADGFWLDGSLRISALEQVDFLGKFHDGAFPYDGKTFAAVKGIMRVESKSGRTIRAKTGWYQGRGEHTGWYVGYVETPGDVWLFAFNCAIRDPSAAALRKEAVREALARLGILR